MGLSEVPDQASALVFCFSNIVIFMLPGCMCGCVGYLRCSQHDGLAIDGY